MLPQILHVHVTTGAAEEIDMKNLDVMKIFPAKKLLALTGARQEAHFSMTLI